jgi:hypothetical protein
MDKREEKTFQGYLKGEVKPQFMSKQLSDAQ